MKRQNISPWESLMWLVLMIFAGAIVGSVLSVLVVLVFNGFDLNQLLAQLSGSELQNLHSIRIIQAGSSLGMFLAPPIFLGMFEGDKNKYFPQKQSLSLPIVGLTLASMISLQPIIQLLAFWNLGMELPEAFRDLETWMKVQEEASEKLVMALLSDVSILGFLSNFIVIAIVAAVAEEALFRGGLQKVFLKIVKNHHVAIWLVAIIFSAIHLQFYGFLPRLFMGAFFGYLMYWTQNIWIPIIAHLLNNGAAVVQAYYVGKTEGNLNSINEMEWFPVYIYIFAFIISAYLIFNIYTKTHNKNPYGK